MELKFSLSAKPFARRLLMVLTVLIFLALCTTFLKVYTNDFWFFTWLAEKFDLDMEGNFPSIYSGCALAFSALLLFVISKLEKLHQSKYSRSWTMLSGIFLFLAIDELVSLHELFVTEQVRKSMGLSGIFYFAWVLPASIMLVIFVVAFFKFLMHLNQKTRMQFILAGAIFVLGALGCEMIGGYVAEGYFEAKAIGAEVPRSSVYIYNILVIVEEGLEMLGVVLFIYALLAYMNQRHSIREVVWQFPVGNNQRQASTDRRREAGLSAMHHHHHTMPSGSVDKKYPAFGKGGPYWWR